MNYKLLLEKYIKHVLSIEGVTFLDGGSLKYSEIEFTKEDLIKLDKYFISIDFNYINDSQRVNIKDYVHFKKTIK